MTQRKKLSPLLSTENQEQITAMKWLDLKGIPAFHVPNGGKRNAVEAMKFKAMGVKPGIPDIFIPVAKKGFHGLFIELKRAKNAYLSDHQQWWMTELSKQGYAVTVCYGADQLIRFVSKYMEIHQ